MVLIIVGTHAQGRRPVVAGEVDARVEASGYRSESTGSLGRGQRKVALLGDRLRIEHLPVRRGRRVRLAACIPFGLIYARLVLNEKTIGTDVEVTDLAHLGGGAPVQMHMPVRGPVIVRREG